MAKVAYKYLRVDPWKAYRGGISSRSKPGLGIVVFARE